VAGIYLGQQLPAVSSDLPEGWRASNPRTGRERPVHPLSGLAPNGVCPASRSPDCW